MNTDNATPELFAALSEAQGEIENASKNASNPHFRSQYADLAEILNTVRPIFAKYGLTLTQSPSYDGSLVSVTTVIGHKSGGFISGVASCVPAKSDAQGIGSATTYLRRYSAAGMAGIAQEDDDGNSAAHDKKPNTSKPAPKQAPKPEPKQPGPNAQALAKFREDAIKQAHEAGITSANQSWGNTHLKAASESTGLSLASVETYTEEQVKDIMEEAYIGIMAEIEQAQAVKNA